MTGDPLEFTLINETTKTAVLYTGVSTTLDICLTNNTGAAIGLSAAAGSTSTLTLYLARSLFTAEEFGHLAITPPAGWTWAADSGAYTITLTCTADASWADQATLTFPIAQALTTAQPTPTVVARLAPNKLVGNVPRQVNAPIAVTLPPRPGNISLVPDVLQVSLENQGLVYCSDSSNTLVNRLSLTCKNIGDSALATDKILHGQPQVLISFVYGSTGGALAPDSADANSAWFITGGIQTQPPKAAWTPPGKPVADSDGHPTWPYAPSEGNTAILAGVRTDSANVTFAFDHVVANRNPGHTQMFVLCTGFRKDASTAYDDHLYVLDINKQAPPPTLGVLAFAAEKPVITIADPLAKVDIGVSWTTFGAASVNLVTSSEAVALANIPSTPGSGLLAYGNTKLAIDPPPTSQALFLTLQGLDSAGGYLGGAQYTAYLELGYVQDPNGWVYRVARYKNRYWTLADYAYPAAGSYVYGDPPNPPAGTPRLYTQAAAEESAPPGWSLPAVADWQGLVDDYQADPYAALIVGGSSRFDANLTGLRMGGAYKYLAAAGYYWSSSNSAPLTQFSSGSGQVAVGVPWPGTVEKEFAVRYVRPA